MEAEQIKFGVIIAARSGSKRLPGKALLPLFGIPVIVLIIRRLRTSRKADKIVFATTDLPEDDVLAEVVRKEGIDVFRGASEDVLSRYVNAALRYDFNYVVRVTGDCPFVDGETLDQVLEQCVKFPSFDLATTKPNYPHGIDYEIYPKKILEEINKLDITSEDREHHLNYIYNHKSSFRIYRLQPPAELLCDETLFLLDTTSDYNLIKGMIKDINDIFISPIELIKRYASAN